MGAAIRELFVQHSNLIQMKLRYTFLFTMLLSLGVLTACDDDDDPAIDYTATYPISGDWTVTYSVEDGAGGFEPLVEGAELLIYNTAANTANEVWVDDHGNFWDFKVKTGANVQNRTFGGEALQNVSYESQVTITDGQVFLNGTESNGLQRDSIYFRVSFDDDQDANGDPDPYGTVYHVYGHRSTGFE